jgi:hypothetical protein
MHQPCYSPVSHDVHLSHITDHRIKCTQAFPDLLARDGARAAKSLLQIVGRQARLGEPDCLERVLNE